MSVIYEEKTFSSNFDSLVVTPVDDAWHPVADKDYVEWWYFDSLNNDESTVRGRLYLMGNPSQPNKVKCGVRFDFVEPDGNEILIDEIFPYSSFSASKDECNVRIGDNYVEGDLRRYNVHAESEEKVLDLDFVSNLRGFKPNPEGKAYFDNKSNYMAWVVPQPRSRVTGTFTANGETWKISGDGYHDHNWSNIPWINCLTKWRWGRINDERFTILFAVIDTSKKFNNFCIKTLSVYDEKKMLFATSENKKWRLEDYISKIDSVSKVEYPEVSSLKIEDEGMSLDFRFTLQRTFERVDVLQGYNPLIRRLIRTFKANPFMLTFLSQGSGQLIRKGKKNDLSGTVLHELFNFKK